MDFGTHFIPRTGRRLIKGLVAAVERQGPGYGRSRKREWLEHLATAEISH